MLFTQHLEMSILIQLQNIFFSRHTHTRRVLLTDIISIIKIHFVLYTYSHSFFINLFIFTKKEKVFFYEQTLNLFASFCIIFMSKLSKKLITKTEVYELLKIGNLENLKIQKTLNPHIRTVNIFNKKKTKLKFT